MFKLFGPLYANQSTSTSAAKAAIASLVRYLYFKPMEYNYNCDLYNEYSNLHQRTVATARERELHPQRETWLRDGQRSNSINAAQR